MRHAERALPIVFLWLALAATCEGKKRPFVLVCYEAGDARWKKACDWIKSYVSDPNRCEDAYVIEVEPRDPTPAQIAQFFRDRKKSHPYESLPPNVLTVVSGEGLRRDPDDGEHRLAVGG